MSVIGYITWCVGGCHNTHNAPEQTLYIAIELSINSERQVSSYCRTIDFESYQLITFANLRQVWSIHTR